MYVCSLPRVWRLWSFSIDSLQRNSVAHDVFPSRNRPFLGEPTQASQAEVLLRKNMERCDFLWSVRTISFVTTYAGRQTGGCVQLHVLYVGNYPLFFSLALPFYSLSRWFVVDRLYLVKRLISRHQRLLRNITNVLSSVVPMLDSSVPVTALISSIGRVMFMFAIFVSWVAGWMWISSSL